MLRLIKLIINPQDGTHEGAIDISLDRLPNYFLDQSVRGVKLLEDNNTLFVLLFYSNGSVVLLDLVDILQDQNFGDPELSSVYSEIICSFILVAVVSFVMMARRILLRRRARP